MEPIGDLQERHQHTCAGLVRPIAAFFLTTLGAAVTIPLAASATTGRPVDAELMGGTIIVATFFSVFNTVAFLYALEPLPMVITDHVDRLARVSTCCAFITIACSVISIALTGVILGTVFGMLVVPFLAYPVSRVILGWSVRYGYLATARHGTVCMSCGYLRPTATTDRCPECGRRYETR